MARTCWGRGRVPRGSCLGTALTHAKYTVQQAQNKPPVYNWLFPPNQLSNKPGQPSGSLVYSDSNDDLQYLCEAICSIIPLSINTEQLHKTTTSNDNNKNRKTCQ